MIEKLDVYYDMPTRSAALNMAIDEALLESATTPAIRFYRWDHPALSFGYFGRFIDVAHEERDLVRRWTGGGIVFHGDDLTYSIVIPANDPAFAESSMAIYEKTHCAIQRALAASGAMAELAAISISTDAGGRINHPGYNQNACFANPVRADVMVDGRKVAGAAQRRTRRGLLEQGSIQDVDLAPDFRQRFAQELCANCSVREIEEAILARAGEIAAIKYATDAWLRRR